MGWTMEYVTSGVYVSLDEHGGQKERDHVELADKLRTELNDAIRAICSKPEYAEIMPDGQFL